MKKEFLIRILSSIVLISIIILIMRIGSIVFNFFLLLCFFVSLYEWHKMSVKKKYYHIGIIFLIISFYSAYELFYINAANSYFLFVLFICIFTDIGGYIFGKLIKGPRLTSISPKKTYAGVFGSFFLTIIFVFYFSKISYLFPETLSFSINVIIISIAISFISQIGDITISYFKRLSNLKDTGNILPGHGGLLDRVDGMIFAFPFSYILIYFKLL